MTILSKKNLSDMPFIIFCDLNINGVEGKVMLQNYRKVISSNGFKLKAEQATKITDIKALA